MKLIIVPRCTFRSALPKMSARPESHRAHSGYIAILAIHYKFGRILSLWLSAYFSFFLGQDAAFAVIHFRWNMALCIINAQHSFAVMDSCCRILVCPGQGSPGQNSGIHEKYGSWYKNEHTIVHAWFCLMDHQGKKRTAFAFVWS